MLSAFMSTTKFGPCSIEKGVVKPCHKIDQVDVIYMLNKLIDKIDRIGIFQYGSV